MALKLVLGLFLASFAVTYLATQVLIDRARKKGLVERDDNKKGKPLVAGMGGFAIFGGIAAGILLGVMRLVFLEQNETMFTLLLASLSCITILALIGIFDDVFRLTRRTKPFLPVVGAAPLVAVKAGQSIMSIPFLGQVNFGPFYNFLLVPLGVTGAANATNMAAGYNGVEAGIGAVISFFLLVIAVSTGSTAAAIVLAACLGACVAFLFFNWFPARIFPGDIGTLVIGATIASAVIIGNMEKYGAIMFIPAFYELGATIYYSLKGVERRPACHNPTIAYDNRLIPPKGSEKFTLFYLILGFKPMREAALVKTVLGIYALFGLLALGLFYLGGI